jgi:aryl-alcohol dehydrogenase-like predicted oxidoreductase
MNNLNTAGSFPLGDRSVKRLGFGAMQLAGPGVFGPPKDRDAALAVLRAAVASGVNHIDTSDYYGPHVTNALIREALHPYPEDLVIVTKVGGVRGEDASWHPAMTPAQLTSAVHDNLRNLGLESLEVVNLRIMGEGLGPSEGSIEEPLTALAELQRQGLIQHLGLSNVVPSPKSSACRTTIISPTATTTRLSMRWRSTALPTCRSSRSAVSRRCNRQRCPTWRHGAARLQCR